MAEFMVDKNSFGRLGALGVWYDPSTWFQGSNSGEDAGTVMDALYKMFDQVMVDRRLLLKAMQQGSASYQDMADFDKIAENYNTLVRMAALKFKEKGISFGGRFAFFKTSGMKDFSKYCCWEKQYSMKSDTGLAGFNLGLENASLQNIMIMAGMLSPLTALVGIVTKIMGSDFGELFGSNSSFADKFKDKIINKVAEVEYKKAEQTGDWIGAWTSVGMTEAMFNQRLKQMGLEPPPEDPKKKGILAEFEGVLGKLIVLSVIGFGGYAVIKIASAASAAKKLKSLI